MKYRTPALAFLAFLSGFLLARAAAPFDLLTVVVCLLMFFNVSFLFHQLGVSIDRVLDDNDRLFAENARLRGGGK